jgi:Mn2+/Fe2+ NRAMP family transporter
MSAPRTHRGVYKPFRRVLSALGPGLTTGAADDDPSGIATYSQAGAQFGFSLTWTMLLTLPFMAAIQIISACIGWQTRKGLVTNLARGVPRTLLYGLVGSLVVANTINIAADIAAMGEALRLVVGGSTLVYAIAFGCGCVTAEVLVPYHHYAGYLKFLTVVLFAYVAAAFTVHVPWSEVILSTILPTLSFSDDFLLIVVAVFGTTISPYLFFWQASQEAEESRLSHRGKFGRQLAPGEDYFSHISTDTWIGMSMSNVIALFIMVTTAATLHAPGLTKIETAAQAAEALRPVAGPLTFAFFAAGIIGTGLLAVPILAGSAAYAVAEAFRLRGSLELPASRAIGFYAIVGAATLGGTALATTNIDPISMLFWSAVINGIVAVPIMAAMMIAVSRKPLKSSVRLPFWVLLVGWIGTALMTVAVGLFLWSSSTSR